jgi:hypothetical protein
MDMVSLSIRISKMRMQGACQWLKSPHDVGNSLLRIKRTSIYKGCLVNLLPTPKEEEEKLRGSKWTDENHRRHDILQCIDHCLEHMGLLLP